LDFGLVEGPIQSPDIIRKSFMDDELIVICGNNHPFRKRKYVTIEELSNADLILREKGSGTRELFENVMASKGYNLDVKWTCNNAETIKNTVISNIGISVISKIAVEQELSQNRLTHIEVEGLELKRKFSIIYHKNKYISRPIKDFWEQCFYTYDMGKIN
ncbi:MAG TPA: LysR family transcriptional regulator, partial [Tepidimicrobium sp.]|nr:LysR family transcriptional regulator [Tepidimicrobium sp.]